MRIHHLLLLLPLYLQLFDLFGLLGSFLLDLFLFLDGGDSLVELCQEVGQFGVDLVDEV
jgi:hypothetical protein